MHIAPNGNLYDPRRGIFVVKRSRSGVLLQVEPDAGRAVAPTLARLGILVGKAVVRGLARGLGPVLLAGTGGIPPVAPGDPGGFDGPEPPPGRDPDLIEPARRAGDEIVVRLAPGVIRAGQQLLAGGVPCEEEFTVVVTKIAYSRDSSIFYATQAAAVRALAGFTGDSLEEQARDAAHAAAAEIAQNVCDLRDQGCPTAVYQQSAAESVRDSPVLGPAPRFHIAVVVIRGEDWQCV